jgi:hypothetical protein
MTSRLVSQNWFGLCLFGVGLVLSIAGLVFLAKAIGPIFFVGGDGKGFQTHILTYLSFASFPEVNVFNPLQAMFNQQLPINIWSNPAYAVFHFFSHDTALIAAAIVGYAALATATFCLARVYDVPLASAVAGSLGCIVAFPPFFYTFGLNSQYGLVPPTAFTVAIGTLAIVLIVQFRSLQWRPILTGIIAVFATLAYALTSDPMYFIAGIMALAPAAAVLVLAGATREAIAARTIIAGGAIVLMVATGFYQYLHGLIAYTARYQFPDEAVRPALALFASSLLGHPLLAGRLFVFLVPGMLIGCFLARERTRILFVAILVQWLTVIGLGAAFLFGGFYWSLPAPLYFEQGAYHLYALGGIAGWGLLATKSIAPFLPIAWKPITTRAIWLAGIVAVPGFIAVYFWQLAPQLRNLLVEPWPQQHALKNQLKNRIGLHSDRNYRGTAALAGGMTYFTILSQVDLWRDGIPTFNEYGQLVTPQMQFFVTRMLTRDRPGSMNGYQIMYPKPAILSMMGVRFVIISPATEAQDRSSLLTVDGVMPGNKLDRRYLRELPDPNLGNYSPTEVIHAKTASEIVSIIDGDFDPRRQVVVPPGKEISNLVPAKSAVLQFVNGRIRIKAQSPERSLLMLPVQFSNCIKLAHETPNVFLLRTNLVFTGLIFDREVDTELVFNFGFLTPKCRSADLRNLTELGLANQKNNHEIPRSYLFPYSIDSVSSVAHQFDALTQEIKRAVAADRTIPWLF